MYGEITKIMRSKKLMAVVTIEVPTGEAGKIPVGAANITIEAAQKEMSFEE